MSGWLRAFRWRRLVSLACAVMVALEVLAVNGGAAALAGSREDAGGERTGGGRAGGERAGGERAGGSAGPDGGRVPLVYVGPEGSGGRLFECLRSSGYADGRDLLVVVGGEGDYVLEAADVTAAVRQAQAADDTRVDLIAVGPSSLAARLAMLVMEAPIPVRTLIMVAPPNRGSFAATALRLAAQLERQVAFRTALGRLPAGERPSDPEPLDEAAYLATRAYSVYEPLVARYYRDDKFSSEGGNYPDFLSWLAHKEKELFGQAIAGAQAPPAIDRYPALAELARRPPEIDESLTRAFFEVEAARAAEYNFARLFQEKRPLTLKDLGLTEVLTKAKSGGLKRLVVDLLTRLAESLGARALAERLSQVEGLAATKLLDFDAWAAPAARLTAEEYVLPPAGGAAPGRGEVILANYFLKFWNEREAARRLTLENLGDFATAAGPPDPRYVTIAPNWPNLWAALPALTGAVKPLANDLRTELRSMSLPVRENDSFIVVRGAPSADPASLLERRDVQDLILSELGGGARPKPVRPREKVPAGAGTWKTEGKLEAVANRPSYLEVQSDLLSGPGRLVVELSPPSRREPGLVLAAWAYAESDDGTTERIELNGAGPASPLSADLGSFGGACRRVLVGLRFKAEPGLERVLDPGTKAPAQVVYRITWVPESAAGPASDGGRGDPGDGAPGDSDTGGEVGNGPGTGKAGPPPTIAVIRRSKKTTHRVARRTVHQKWEWDFGDGTGAEDLDPAHTDVTRSHTYAPGKYTATARSINEAGAVIRQLTWEVTVPEGGDALRREFKAETIREPRVKIVIDGPKMWVTGKPAEFRVSAEVDDPPFSDDKTVSIDPGPVFSVVWARPGTFEVAAAVTVRLSYRFPERSVFVIDTYIEKVQVQVCATAATE